MILGELKTAVKRLFGDESQTFLEDADIVRWCNEACVEIVRQTECVKSTSTVAISAGVTSYSLTSSFMFMKSMVLGGTTLTPVGPESLSFNISSSAYSTPANTYALLDSESGINTLYLSVENTLVSGTLYYVFVPIPTVIILDATALPIPTEYHDKVVDFVMMRAKEMEEDFNASSMYREKFRSSLLGIREDTTRQGRFSYSSIRLLDGDD